MVPPGTLATTHAAGTKAPAPSYLRTRRGFGPTVQRPLRTAALSCSSPVNMAMGGSISAGRKASLVAALTPAHYSTATLDQEPEGARESF